MASGFLSERIGFKLGVNTVVGNSYTVAQRDVDLSLYGADSCLALAVINGTTLTGFTMTAIGGNATDAMGAYCQAAGSTTAVLTASSTAPSKYCWIDVKNCGHRYFGVKETALGTNTGVTIMFFPYDSKSNPISAHTTTVTAAISSTAQYTGWTRNVSPTTA